MELGLDKSSLHFRVHVKYRRVVFINCTVCLTLTSVSCKSTQTIVN